MLETIILAVAIVFIIVEVITWHNGLCKSKSFHKFGNQIAETFNIKSLIAGSHFRDYFRMEMNSYEDYKSFMIKHLVSDLDEVCDKLKDTNETFEIKTNEFVVNYFNNKGVILNKSVRSNHSKQILERLLYVGVLGLLRHPKFTIKHLRKSVTVYDIKVNFNRKGEV